MNIEEIKKKQAILEGDILNLIFNFKTETGGIIYGIEVTNTVTNMANKLRITPTSVSVDVRV